MTTRRAVWLVLKLATTGGLLGLLVFVVSDSWQLLRRIAELRGWAVAAAVAVATGDRVLMAYKWRLLLVARGVALPLSTAIRAYFATSFAGLFLPVTLGADAIRVLAVRRFGAYDVTASIIVERTLGAVAMLSLAMLSCALLASTLGVSQVGPVTGAIIGAALLIAAAIPVSLWIAVRVGRRSTGVSSKLGRLAEAYGGYARHPVTLLWFYALSVVESLLPAVTTWIVCLGLGIEAPFRTFLATVPIAISVARLPVSLGGFGVLEASFVYLAGLTGMRASDALATMLVSDAVLILTLLPSAFDVGMMGLRRREAQARP